MAGAEPRSLPTDWDRRFRRDDRQLSVAVVGLGYWGPKLVRNLLELDNVAVGAVCDVDRTALERQGRRHPGLGLTDSYEEILADERIEAVVIATPIATHYDLARKAIEANKHVMVEKPLAATLGEAAELRRLAAERGVLIMPGHTFLYSPPVVAVKKLIESGQLGQIRFGTSSRVNLGIHQRDLSVIRDLAPHDFSILLFWLGAPSFVRAIGRGAAVENLVDVAFVDVGYDDGCIVHLDLSWLAPTKLRRTVLVGDRQMVVYEDTSSEQVRVFDRGVERIEPESFGEFQLAYRSGDILTPHLEPIEPLRLELDDFARAVRTGQKPRSDVELGLAVVAMMEAAERSLAEGGPPVELDLAVALSGDAEIQTQPS